MAQDDCERAWGGGEVKLGRQGDRGRGPGHGDQGGTGIGQEDEPGEAGRWDAEERHARHAFLLNLTSLA